MEANGIPSDLDGKYIETFWKWFCEHVPEHVSILSENSVRYRLRSVEIAIKSHSVVLTGPKQRYLLFTAFLKTIEN